MRRTEAVDVWARKTRRHLALLALLAMIVFGGSSAAESAEEKGGRPPGQSNRELFAEQIRAAGKISDADAAVAIDQFRRVWVKESPVLRSKFLGVSTVQNPMDAWVVWETIYEARPNLIVEAGTHRGGSAALWAVILEQVSPDGRVITIDIEDRRDAKSKALDITKRKVTFLLGSSTAPDVVAEVHRQAKGKRVMVILDSLHTADHVRAELEAYAGLVPVGGYVIVQDTPVGPIDAIDEFLAANPNWTAVREKERFKITNTVKGYLRRDR
jgi:cephalosporin hydroxylase